jgi:hypothetical protein
MKTTEQIAAQFEHLNGRAFIRAVNRYYRDHDESHKWPIRSKFDATERAIRNARTWRRDSGVDVAGLGYVELLETILTEIVNNESNW